MIVFLIILKQELLLSFLNLGKILANFLFFLISVTIFFLLAQNLENKEFTRFYSITIIWFSLIFSLIFSSIDFLKKDFEDGSIEQMLIYCKNFEVFTFAKMFANWLIYCLPILALLPIVALAGNLEWNFIFDFLILAFLSSLAINFICTFCGSLSIGENSASLIGLIALPLIIPIFLIAYSGLDREGGENFCISCKILSGFVILSGAIASFATAKIVKIITE